MFVPGCLGRLASSGFFLFFLIFCLSGAQVFCFFCFLVFCWSGAQGILRFWGFLFWRFSAGLGRKASSDFLVFWFSAGLWRVASSGFLVLFFWVFCSCRNPSMSVAATCAFCFFTLRSVPMIQALAWLPARCSLSPRPHAAPADGRRSIHMGESSLGTKRSLHSSN